MTLQNILPWIQTAHQQKYAIAALNANTMEQMQAITLAAQAENAPVIIQVSHRALHYAGSGNEIRGLQYMAAIGKVAANSVDVPVSLHLDHANENEVLQAIALGFTSVMFDGDGLPLAENIAITKRLCEIVHSAGVCLEAEIGEVPKPDGIAQGIKYGLAKVNIATQLNKAFTGAVRGVLTADDDLVDPRKYLEAGRQAQIEAARERLRFVGAAGKATGC